MTEAKMPDHIWDWVEVSDASGRYRRRLPTVLFDSQEHFDAVIEKWNTLQGAGTNPAEAAPGEVCEHGSLDQSCLICELQADVASLAARAARAEARLLLAEGLAAKHDEQFKDLRLKLRKHFLLEDLFKEP